MTSTVHEGSSEQLQVTSSSGKSIIWEMICFLYFLKKESNLFKNFFFLFSLKVIAVISKLTWLEHTSISQTKSKQIDKEVKHVNLWPCQKKMLINVFFFLLQNFVFILLSIIYKIKRKIMICINLSLCFYFTGQSKDEEKKLSEEEEEKKALSKYLSMDYRTFRRRRPVHNKALPLDPWKHYIISNN